MIMNAIRGRILRSSARNHVHSRAYGGGKKYIILKAVAIDLQVVLSDQPVQPPNPVLSIAAEAPPLSSDGLDMDPTGNRRLSQVPEAAHTGRLITGTSTTSTADAETRKKLESMLKKQDGSPLDPKAKYAEKLRMKMAKSAQKKSVQGDSVNAATRWLLREGMGDILDYTYHRAVKLAGVGAFDRSSSTISQFLSQMHGTSFSFLRDSLSDDALRRGDAQVLAKDPRRRGELWTQQFEALEQKLQVAQQSLLFVSGDETALALARDRGYYTCRYTGDERRFGQITTDFRAENPLGIRDALDELMGVALRNSVSFTTPTPR